MSNFERHESCRVRCAGYGATDFVCGEFCERLARDEHQREVEKAKRAEEKRMLRKNRHE